MYLSTARTISVDLGSAKLESNDTGSGNPYGNIFISPAYLMNQSPRYVLEKNSIDLMQKCVVSPLKDFSNSTSSLLT